jgi:3-mercaptopyruvate sulfurtransferase SseA
MRNKRKNNALLPVILFALVLVLSIGVMVLTQNLRQAQIASPSEYNSPDQIPRVTAAEAYQAALNGEAVLLDTRAAAQFNAQHVTGAINIPTNEVEARLGELDPDTWYITYCT